MRNQFDLIVVGTGFASTFFLHRYLSKAPRHAKVLVLERGYLYPFRLRRQSRAGVPSTPPDPNPKPDDVYLNRNPDKHWAFSIGFGGSSNCWYACTPRLMPSDFRMKTLYGVAEDWPVTYDDLESYYRVAEELMAVAGPDETPFPKNYPYPLPAHRFSTVDECLHNEYGPLYISQPSARASAALKGRSACCANAVCSLCPANAKFTIENSGMKVFDDPRVSLLFGANVHSLDLQGSVARAVNVVVDGNVQQFSAEVVALGANAIFNASILLSSGDDHPMTGKGLGEQVGLDAVVFLDGLDNDGGSTWVTANGYMLYDGDHRKNYAACLIESNNAPYLRLESKRWRQVAVFRMIFEDLPEDGNRVAPGSQLPEVIFGGHSDYAAKGIEKMKENLPALLRCLPVQQIEFLPVFKTEAHILGTTRMSERPDGGVVDGNLVHHRYRNVFVLGGGSFTTFSPANPTLTIAALSLRAADRSFSGDSKNQTKV